jgi:catechol 2,3-dioxygenase-like lactoylglutathione lyase family enzyme
LREYANQGKPVSEFKHVAPVFRVSDLDRSLSYYQSQLGFEVSFNHEGRYASVVRDGCHIHLKRVSPPDRNQAAFEDEEHLDAYFEVHDAQDLASRLATAGATFSVPLRSQPYGKEFYVEDPDGYILGFVQSAVAQNT